MKLNGAAILIECLIEQGVGTVFGFPGGAVLPIYDELYKRQDRIHHVLTAHEQHAGHAADGYARASGKTGVCIATSGPGATNLVTPIATAYMDSTPIVFITGNVPQSLMGTDSFQEADISGMTMPVTKHNYLVTRVDKLADEDPCVTLIKDGATNIQVVYPVEGTVFLPAQIGIVKNAKNVENAKAFVDFMLSEDAQRFLAENTTSRNVREVEYKNDVMTPLADIKLIYEDSDYVIAHTSELKEKVQDIMMDM